MTISEEVEKAFDKTQFWIKKLNIKDTTEFHFYVYSNIKARYIVVGSKVRFPLCSGETRMATITVNIYSKYLLKQLGREAT